MSTVTSMISAGVSGVSGSSYTSSSSSTSSTLQELSNELDSVRSSTTLTDEEKQAQLDSINEKISSLVSTQTTSSSGSSNIVSTMLGQDDDSNTDTCDFSFFFGSGYTLANVKSLASASKMIENEARILTSEIAVDKIRGLDTADKEEKLTNLTANVSILNQNLASQIESALADEEADEETLSVIGQINEELKANQEKLDKEFNTETDTVEETEETATAQ